MLLWGEHDDYDPETIAQTVETVHSVRTPAEELLEVSVTAAPMCEAGYQRIASAEIGTFQIFQETYHHRTYRKMHPPRTTKGDYLRRLDAPGQAMEAGLNDVGIGALLGLYDWRFEVLGLVAHARHLRTRHGTGPSMISIPRLRPASGVLIALRHHVTDEDMERMTAILRLAIPSTVVTDNFAHLQGGDPLDISL